MIKAHFELMANYNAVMNQKINDAIDSLSEDTLWEDKGAFFGSILATLNHLMVGDLIWLSRFKYHLNHDHYASSGSLKSLQILTEFPSPVALSQILYNYKADFISHRQALDMMIIQFITEIDDSDYAKILTYTNTKGSVHHKPFSMLLQHFFNHQTHHRGQVTTLLSQRGINVGETDLLMLIAEV